MTAVLTAFVKESISLFYVGGTSDKEYHLYLCQHDDGKFSVHAEYGKRSSPNQSHDKTAAGRLSRRSAKSVYDKQRDAKMADGYQPLPDPRPPRSIPGAYERAPETRGRRLADCMARYLTASEDAATAGAEAYARLVSRLSMPQTQALARLSLLPPVFRALLGDLATVSQEYIDDAIEVFEQALLATRGPASLRLLQLHGELSTDLRACLEDAARAAGFASGTEFLAKELEPAVEAGIF